jgi:hypothetical protein
LLSDKEKVIQEWGEAGKERRKTLALPLEKTNPLRFPDPMALCPQHLGSNTPRRLQTQLKMHLSQSARGQDRHLQRRNEATYKSHFWFQESEFYQAPGWVIQFCVT